MDPWEAEQARRLGLIRSAYYNYFGTSDPDQAGLQHWLNRSQALNNDQKLIDEIAYVGGAGRQPGLSAQVLSDPEYAAWFRGMQLDESQTQSALAAARDAAMRRIGVQNSMYDTQQKQAEQNVNDNAEARGMYRSGGRLQQLNDTTTEFDRQRAAYNNSVSESLSEAERDAARQLAELRRQNAERVLATRTRMTENTVGAPIR